MRARTRGHFKCGENIHGELVHPPMSIASLYDQPFSTDALSYTHTHTHRQLCYIYRLAAVPGVAREEMLCLKILFRTCTRAHMHADILMSIKISGRACRIHTYQVCHSASNHLKVMAKNTFAHVRTRTHACEHCACAQDFPLV